MDMWKILALSCVVAAGAEASGVGASELEYKSRLSEDAGLPKTFPSPADSINPASPVIRDMGLPEGIGSDTSGSDGSIIVAPLEPDDSIDNDGAEAELTGAEKVRAGAGGFLTALAFYPRAANTSLEDWAGSLTRGSKELLSAFVHMMTSSGSVELARCLAAPDMTEVQKAVLVCAQLCGPLDLTKSWTILQDALEQAFPGDTLEIQLEMLREAYANNAGY